MPIYLEILEIRNYRNLYFDQKAKENAQSLWGNSIEKYQVDQGALGPHPDNNYIRHVAGAPRHGPGNTYLGAITGSYQWINSDDELLPYICEQVRKCMNFKETIIIPGWI